MPAPIAPVVTSPSASRKVNGGHAVEHVVEHTTRGEVTPDHELRNGEVLGRALLVLQGCCHQGLGAVKGVRAWYRQLASAAISWR
jgi:hypothetical protein